VSPEPAADQLLVTIHQGVAYVRVRGRGSFKVSAQLRDFVIAAIEKGCRCALLDLTDCVGMDSTFMGVLAGLAFRLKEHGGGRVIMINLSPRTRGLLATLGLDQVVDAYMAGATPDRLQAVGRAPEAPLTPLEAGEPSQRATAETMLEAHENLVLLSPENLPKFKDVLAYLREDLKKSERASPPAQ
jgi:anti-anti-sigma factor